MLDGQVSHSSKGLPRKVILPMNFVLSSRSNVAYFSLFIPVAVCREYKTG